MERRRHGRLRDQPSPPAPRGVWIINEYDVQRFYRDAKIVEIYEGSKEVEKAVVASELLKRVF